MDVVNETLQQLVDRRLREMGEERGRGEPLSLLEAYQAVAKPEATYEVFRRIQNEGHTKIKGPTVRTLATMLKVDENEIRAAARQAPAGEPFVLPERAAKLTPEQRKIVLSLVDEFVASADAAAASFADSLMRLMISTAAAAGPDTDFVQRYVIAGEDVLVTGSGGEIRVTAPTLDRINRDPELYKRFMQQWLASLDAQAKARADNDGPTPTVDQSNDMEVQVLDEETAQPRDE